MTIIFYVTLAVIGLFISFVLFKDISYIYYISYAKRIIKKNSYTFYKAFSRIQNTKKRDAIYVVYAFCRYADDIIDEHKDVAGLQQLKKDLHSFKEGKALKSKIFRSLARIRHSFYHKDYDFKPYFDMIKGQEMDLVQTHYETLDQLLTYCYHVASSVGMMLIPILAKEDVVLERFALHLGYAMQITNILRDVGEDYHKGRIYIPETILKTFDVQIKDEMINGPSQSFKNMFSHMEEIARMYYDRALKDISQFPEDVRKPLYFAAVLYRAILDKCIEVGYDVLRQKPFLNDKEKMAVIMKAGHI